MELYDEFKKIYGDKDWFHTYPVSSGSSDSAGFVCAYAPCKQDRHSEPFGPPDTLQMASAGRLISEEMLKLQQSPGVI